MWSSCLLFTLAKGHGVSTARLPPNSLLPKQICSFVILPTNTEPAWTRRITKDPWRTVLGLFCKHSCPHRIMIRFKQCTLYYPTVRDDWISWTVIEMGFSGDQWRLLGRVPSSAVDYICGRNSSHRLFIHCIALNLPKSFAFLIILVLPLD